MPATVEKVAVKIVLENGAEHYHNVPLTSLKKTLPVARLIDDRLCRLTLTWDGKERDHYGCPVFRDRP